MFSFIFLNFKPQKILAVLFIVLSSFQMANCSVGYFETYGWPS